MGHGKGMANAAVMMVMLVNSVIHVLQLSMNRIKMKPKCCVQNVM